MSLQAVSDAEPVYSNMTLCFLDLLSRLGDFQNVRSDFQLLSIPKNCVLHLELVKCS